MDAPLPTPLLPTSRRVFPRGIFTASRRHAIVRSWRALLLLVTLVLAAPGAAQALSDTEARLLIDRVDRLELQLGTLQRQLDTTGPTPARAALPGGGKMAPTMAAQLELRVSQLETQLRTLNGRVEEVDHNLSLLKSRLDTVVSDVQYRLTALEGGGAKKPGSAANPPNGKTAPGGTGAALGESGGVKPPAGGVTPQGDAAAAGGGILPAGTPKERYGFAESLLRQGKYDAAEKALRAFIAAHGKNPLAGNAQYWLGETYYVRGRYQDAAVAFLEGFQKYPTGAKAPPDLLKLGMSLARLKKKREACASFRQLQQKYPNARNSLRIAAGERRRLGC